MHFTSKFAPTIAGFCAVALALAGCTSTGASDQNAAEDSTPTESQGSFPTLNRIESSGVVKICTTGDYRPFTYFDPKAKEWSGIDVDMGRTFADDLDAKPEFVRIGWDEFPSKIRKGACDIGMGGLSITTERAAQLYMSDPTAQDGKTPITQCGKVDKYDSIDKINDDDVEVITPKGGTNEEFAAEHFPEAKVIKWDDNNTIFDQIIKGEADVMVTDAPETKWVAHEEPELCAVNPDKPLNFSEQGYAIRSGDDQMLEYLNTWLRITQHDGTYAGAEKKWFG